MRQMTKQEVEEVLRRSAAGEGVIRILHSMGLPEDDSLIYLRDHHHDDVKKAKAEQRKRQNERPR